MMFFTTLEWQNVVKMKVKIKYCKLRAVYAYCVVRSLLKDLVLGCVSGDSYD